MAPLPKRQGEVRRRNAQVRTTISRLPTASQIPDLPSRDDGFGWHPRAVELWERLWGSQLADLMLPTDTPASLLVLVDLTHRYWTTRELAERLAIARELRLQGAGFGISPKGRAALRIELARADEVDDARVRRQARIGKNAVKDPRRRG